LPFDRVPKKLVLQSPTFLWASPQGTRIPENNVKIALAHDQSSTHTHTRAHTHTRTHSHARTHTRARTRTHAHAFPAQRVPSRRSALVAEDRGPLYVAGGCTLESSCLLSPLRVDLPAATA
jgi:hypothetical protein